MLIKRNDFMASRTRSVKKLSFSLLGTLVICTAAIAPNAFAADYPGDLTTVSVTFKAADLEATNGTQKVYTKLKIRAKSFCRSARISMIYFGKSTTKCSSDLLEQFVQSAGIAELEAYHLSQTSAAEPKKYALHKN